MHVPESGLGQVVELRIRRKFGLHRPTVACEELRQEVVALRADDDVNRLRALENFLAFRLRDATCDGDLDVAALRPARPLS